MPAVGALRDDFDNDLRKAEDLLAAVRLPFFQQALIYELAFLRCFLAWEIFLEETFYAYMLRKPAPDGTTYRRYVAPKNTDHAQKIIRGQRRFSAWTNSDEIVRRAELYFDSGEPFTSGLGTISSDLADMVTVRNRIAHRSGSAKTRFLELVRRKHGSVPQGTNAGRFLLGTEAGSSENRFKAYLGILVGASRIIAP